MEGPRLNIGFLVFPGITQLDMTGPFEVFARIPGATVHLVWKTIEPIRSDTGLLLTPTVPFDTCPALDVICVPGGPGINALLSDAPTLEFLRKQAATALYVASVCTGALVLGAAGLLDGYRAATHWASREFLPAFGATPVTDRVCEDRNRVTGGGVSAGIDFGLTLAARLVGREAAERIQLFMEYDPAPPFSAGSPETAPPAVVAACLGAMAVSQDERRRAVARASLAPPANG
jgi:cyclohexyl-isocyanide hydratase